VIGGILRVMVFCDPVADDKEFSHTHATEFNRYAVPRQESTITPRILPPLIVLLLLGAACHRGDEESVPTEHPAGLAPVVDPAPVSPVAVDEFEELEMRIADGLSSAIEFGDVAATQEALSLLGRSLGQLRAGHYSEAFVHAIRWFAAGDNADFRARIDGRRVVAVLEVLLDIRDGAAIHRLHESYGVGPAAERFRAGFGLALSWSNAPSTLLHSQVGCDLSINGVAAEGESTQVLYGSNTVSCDGERARIFVASNPVHRVRRTSDGVWVFDE
jgi:hypothetical protein